MAHEQKQQQAPKSPTFDWKKIRGAAGPYPLEAFNFVREGLSFTVDRVHRSIDPAADVSRHISGQQLCIGLRDFAIDQYGLLAQTVLSHWHVNRTDDFGRIVFAMIEAGLMSKTADDSLDDFRGIFDFAEAFHQDELRSRIGEVCGN